MKQARTVGESVKADLTTDSKRQAEVGKLFLQNLDECRSDVVDLYLSVLASCASHVQLSDSSPCRTFQTPCAQGACTVNSCPHAPLSCKD
jgi:hypothetical protein